MNPQERADKLNSAALAYNHDDAGPCIEYPGLRIFASVNASGVLRLIVWTRDVDEEPTLATDDDLPPDLTLELYRDDDLIHTDAREPWRPTQPRRTVETVQGEDDPDPRQADAG